MNIRNISGEGAKIRGIVDVKTAVAAFIPNVLLLQSLIPIKSIYFSYNAVSWYLSSAMILAILYPFIVKSLDRLSYKGKAITFILLLSAYSTLVYLLPVEHSRGKDKHIDTIDTPDGMVV